MVVWGAWYPDHHFLMTAFTLAPMVVGSGMATSLEKNTQELLLPECKSHMEVRPQAHAPSSCRVYADRILGSDFVLV